MNVNQIIRGLTVSLQLSKLTAIVDYASKAQAVIANITQELADEKQKLVDALSDDAADEEAIANAEAKAIAAQLAADTAKEAVETAKAANTVLQAAADEDASEDVRANSILDSFIIPA